MLSDSASRFLVRYVDSAELLDVLMVLLQEPDGVWTAQALSSRIFTVPQAAQKRLEELVSLGLAAERADHPGAYQVVFRDNETRSCLAELRTSYEANRAQVVNVVFGLKKDPLASFSNAFRLRGDS